MNNLKVGFWVAMLLVILTISIKPNEAARPVSSDHPQEAAWMQKPHMGLKYLQSYLGVKYSPPAPNSGTYIPGPNPKTTTISEMNFAGRTNIPMVPPPPPANAHRDHIIQFGVATNRKLL